MLLCFLQWRDEYRNTYPFMRTRQARTLYALTDLLDLFPVTEAELKRVMGWIEHFATFDAPNY